jgi:hypothetical protein
VTRSSVLGISAYYHDSAACLLVDGRIVAAAQELVMESYVITKPVDMAADSRTRAAGQQLVST